MEGQELIFAADPELKAAVLQSLRDEYKLDIPREGMHQSMLGHCLTLSFWDRTDPLPPTDTEVKLYSIGFAAERVIFKREQTPATMVVDGITLSLDGLELFGPIDLKTSRMRAAGRKGENGFQPPVGWIRQFKTYARALGIQEFGVVVIHLVEPEITAWRMSFSKQEIEDNWQWYIDRSNTLENMLAAGDPQVYQWNEEQSPTSWDCTNCRYNLRCSLTASLAKYGGRA